MSSTFPQQICNTIQRRRSSAISSVTTTPECSCSPPHVPDYMLYLLLKVHYIDTNRDDNIMRAARHILPVLMELWNSDCGELSYLYLACALTDGDKNTRNLASEIWIGAVSKSTLDHAALARHLATLYHDEFIPLKRLTDLIVDNLPGVSSLHDRALETLLMQMIPGMHDTPIKGTKKLLEICLEVQNGSGISKAVSMKFETWGGTRSLAGVIGKIRRK